MLRLENLKNKFGLYFYHITNLFFIKSVCVHVWVWMLVFKAWCCKFGDQRTILGISPHLPLFFVCFFETGFLSVASLCRPHWPRIHRDLLPSASWVLGLKVWATTTQHPSPPLFFNWSSYWHSKCFTHWARLLSPHSRFLVQKTQIAACETFLGRTSETLS